MKDIAYRAFSDLYQEIKTHKAYPSTTDNDSDLEILSPEHSTKHSVSNESFSDLDTYTDPNVMKSKHLPEKFKAPRKTIVGLEEASNPSRFHIQSSDAMAAPTSFVCPRTAICSETLGTSQIFFHSERQELQIQQQSDKEGAATMTTLASKSKQKSYYISYSAIKIIR